jgi:DNA-binding response OmpR family regulator
MRANGEPAVLVVEDESALSTLLRYNLEREGYRVFEARDGEEALILADEVKPDLVVLDWMMPQISGIEVCRRSAAASHAQRSYRDADRPRRGTRPHPRPDTGADDYIVKPFSMTEFLARLRAVMRRVRPSPSKMSWPSAKSALTAARIGCAGDATSTSVRPNTVCWISDGIRCVLARAIARHGLGFGRL